MARKPKLTTTTLRVTLNGMVDNPYHQFGLTQNPFPQMGKYETDRHCLHLAALGGDPIPDVDYIRKHLAGWSPDFIELCCRQFRRGEYRTFIVEWDEAS